MKEYRRVIFKGKPAGEIYLTEDKKIEFVDLSEDVEDIKDGFALGKDIYTPDDSPQMYFAFVKVLENGYIHFSNRMVEDAK